MPSAPWPPATWMTSSYLAQSWSRTDHVAWLSRRAPWLPPVISTRLGGTSGVRGAKPSRRGTPVRTTCPSFNLEPAGRDEAVGGTAGAADEEDGAARHLNAKRPRDRERRLQVPAGLAASDQKSHHCVDCSAMPNPSRGGRC